MLQINISMVILHKYIKKKWRILRGNVFCLPLTVTFHLLSVRSPNAKWLQWILENEENFDVSCWHLQPVRLSELCDCCRCTCSTFLPQTNKSQYLCYACIFPAVSALLSFLHFLHLRGISNCSCALSSWLTVYTVIVQVEYILVR